MSEPAIQPEWLMRLKPKTYIVHYYPSSHAAVISHRNRGRAGRQILNRHLGLSSDCFRSSDETGNRSTLNKNLSLYYKKRKLTGLPATSRNQYTINLSEFRSFPPPFFPINSCLMRIRNSRTGYYIHPQSLRRRVMEHHRQDP